MASQIDLLSTSESSNASLNPTWLTRLDTRSARSLLERAAQLAQDPNGEHESEVKNAAKVIDGLAKDLGASLRHIEKQVQSGGATPELQTAYQNGMQQMQELKNGVSWLNNQLYTAGSPVRMQWTGGGVQVNNVNTAGQGTGLFGAPGEKPLTDGAMTEQAADGQGLRLDQTVDPAVKNNPLYPVIKMAVKDLLQQQLTGQSGSTTSSDGTGSLDANGRPKSILQQIADAAKTDSGFTGAHEESGSPLFKALLASLKKSAQALKDGQKHKGDKSGPADGSSGGGGSGQVDFSGDANVDPNDPNAGSGFDANGNVVGDQGGIDNGGAQGSYNDFGAQGNGGPQGASGFGGPQGADGEGGRFGGGAITAAPAMASSGSEDINGLLMAVLLETYKAGQQDLKAVALRLRGLNQAKDQIRQRLQGERAAADAAAAAGGPNPMGVAAQNDETKLQSLGDDAQLVQMDLQNLAQNQQQLLQMLSNFMKNTHDDSMAIIRHIGGG